MGGSSRGLKLGTSKNGKPMEGFNAGMKGAKVLQMKVVFVCLFSLDGKANLGRVEKLKISAHIDLLPTAEIVESKNYPRADKVVVCAH